MVEEGTIDFLIDDILFTIAEIKEDHNLIMKCLGNYSNI